MKKSIEGAVRLIAVTAAFAAGTPEVASAETHQPFPPNQARAIKLAHKFTEWLYNKKDHPMGVPVPGILNGTVMMRSSIGGHHLV